MFDLKKGSLAAAFLLLLNSTIALSEPPLSTGQVNPNPAPPVGFVPPPHEGGSNDTENPKRYVLEKDLPNELTAQTWARETGDKGQRIVAVVPLRPGKSLFTLESAKPSGKYVVIRGDMPFNSVNLNKMLDAYRPNKFFGIHLLARDSFLMVCSYD
jgi:hypothetical protein